MSFWKNAVIYTLVYVVAYSYLLYTLDIAHNEKCVYGMYLSYSMYLLL